MPENNSKAAEIMGDLAAPHEAPYQYDEKHGYVDASLGDRDVQNDVPVNGRLQKETDLENEEDDGEEAEEEFDSEDELDVVDDGLASANRSDYTKSYNRQRRLLDPDTPASQVPRSNPQQKPKANIAALIDDQISSLARHSGKLKLDDQTAGFKSGSGGHGQERSDRATSEQVLDPRTRMILLQMINRGVVSEVHGCISTGKEANVYHAILEPEDGVSAQKHLAVKIYKTAILHFKDRSKYVSGEFRFQKGFPKRSNRGMVRLWAEKEFRNLKRMHSAGLPVPEPLHLKSHVLVMEFVGSIDKAGRILAAPLLRDIEYVDRTEDQQVEQWQKIYEQMLCCMRIMYQTCRLVHADLSEYNALYDAERLGLTIIDVSQSVEHDHPRSLDFLRMDIKNITDFFARKAVPTLTEPSVYHFVTDEKYTTRQAAMNEVLKDLKAHPVHPEADEEVFRHQYIPQRLGQVVDYEQVADGGISVDGNDLGHQHLLAENGNRSASHQPQADEEEEEEEDTSGNDSSSSNPGEDAGRDAKSSKPRGKRFEDKEARKEHKSLVKEEKRERRKTKMPKHMKKKLVNNKSRSNKK